MFEIINESTAQKDKFREASNKLLNQCFLIRRKEDTKKEYMFTIQNRELMIPYFDLLGYDLVINEDQGVIGLINQFGTGRLGLTKYESIMVLIFRLLYIEKRKQIGGFSEEVVVLMEEVRERYAALEIEAKPMLDKGLERNIIRLLRKYQLVQNLDSNINEPEARIIIYPSIMMAVSVDNMDIYYQQSAQKVREYAGGSESDEL